MDVILGVNGYIYISAHFAQPEEEAPSGPSGPAAGVTNMEESVSATMYSSQNDPIDPETMREIARVRGVIGALVEHGLRVDEDMVVRGYREAVEMARHSEDGEDDIYLGGEKGQRLAAVLTGR